MYRKNCFFFLGALAKLLEATSSSVLYVCLSVCLSVSPSVRIEQLGSIWTDFHDI